MASKNGLRELLDSVDNPAFRWGLVAVGVFILLRLKLILFAAALPVMAYWHYSQQSSESGDGEEDQNQDDGNHRPPRTGDEEDYDDDGGEYDDEHAFRGTPQSGNPSNPYDEDFWSGDKPGASRGDDDILGKDAFDLGDIGGGRPGGMSSPGFSSPGLDDDFMSKLGGGPDFDLLGGGGDDDGLDFLSGGGFGGGGGKKGGGKKGGGKREKGGDRDSKGGGKSGGADPKQVFVAGVGDLPEDEIRSFFEDVGEVERVKLLKKEDGASKGVCFITFSTESEANKALQLHNTSLDGRTLSVRMAHGGNKGDGKGDSKGDKGSKGNDRGFDRGPRDFDRDAPLDLGGSERFGAAFGFGGGDDRPKGGGKKGGGGGGGKSKSSRGDRNELDEILEEELSRSDGPLRPGDFDFAAKRFLSELRSRDRTDGTDRFQDALDMVFKYTSSKERSAVRKWPAYVFTLLQKFDSNLWEELRERDAERRQQKGGGKGGKGGRSPGFDDMFDD